MYLGSARPGCQDLQDVALTDRNDVLTTQRPSCPLQTSCPACSASAGGPAGAVGGGRGFGGCAWGSGVQAVLLGVGDQLSGGALDVFGQRRNGGFGLPGDRGVTQLTVFAGDVPGVVVGERPVPPSVELGAVPQGGDDALEARTGAA